MKNVNGTEYQRKTIEKTNNGNKNEKTKEKVLESTNMKGRSQIPKER